MVSKMKNTLLLVTVCAGFLLSTGCGGVNSANRQPWPAGRWVDLSHDFSSDTIYWPTAAKFTLEQVSAGMTEKGYYYAANRFSAAEHGGTHIDAPIHFARGHMTVDEIPLEQLIGPAVVVDVSQKCVANRDYQVSQEDITTWEAKEGRIPDNSIVLLRTGYDRYWPDMVKYLGTDKRGEDAVAELHFPGLHPDTARWLVQNRKISAVGLDTPSIDYGQSTLFQSHQILFANDVPALENVANLDQLPATGAWVLALPMKIKGGSGAPLRIVALVPEGVPSPGSH